MNKMNLLELEKIPGVKIGKNVHIECEQFNHEGAFIIEDNVTLLATHITLGHHAKIERNTTIKGISETPMSSFTMGDESLLGFNSQVLVPLFKMGDYTRIFSNALCNGYKPLLLGHNGWIGQSTLLNSTEHLTIGDNVRIGGHSQIWTHVASGELLEGCQFHSEKPVVIEDNVWLMGFGHTVSPGVTLKHNTIVMSGSVMSKSSQPYHTYSGIPAVDITDKLNGWKPISLPEKFAMLSNFLEEFKQHNPAYEPHVFCFDFSKPEHHDKLLTVMQEQQPCLIFSKEITDWSPYKNTPHSFFDLTTKRYLKKRSEIEVAWMKWSIGHRARFIPL